MRVTLADGCKVPSIECKESFTQYLHPEKSEALDDGEEGPRTQYYEEGRGVLGDMRARPCTQYLEE